MILWPTLISKVKTGFCGLSALLLTVALQAQSSVTLQWDPSTDASVVGYRLYEGVASRTYTNSIDAGSNTLITVYGLMPGVTYYFAVTAYDSSGLESDFSDEVSYVAPPDAPTLQLILVPGQSLAMINGTAPTNRVYDVMASSDMRGWAVIGSVASDGAGAFQFSDPQATNACRFYRLRASGP